MTGKPTPISIRLDEIEENLRAALAAIGALRETSSVPVSDEPIAVPDNVAQKLRTLSEDFLPSTRNLNGIFRVLIKDRIRTHFALTGNIGSSVLLCLIEKAGEFVKTDEIAVYAGINTSNNGRTIRVYICRLRSSLAHIGFDPEAIETGLYSYRFDSGRVPALLAYLLDDETYA